MLPVSLLAQQSPDNVDAKPQSALEEIVVTARRRTETLQDIPIAITAFSSADLQKADMVNLEDVALSSPGLAFANQGGQTLGRVDSVIRFRGMQGSSGALFQDGMYVLGSAHSMPLDDLQRVEVIKGPQAAYFGRNTFGGAVNYITNTPSLTESSARIYSKMSNRDDWDMTVSLTYPLIEDKLSMHLGVRQFQNGGDYRATDGGRLGEETSKMAYLTLYSEPTEKLSIKFRAHYGEDSDGPAAGALIAGVQNDSCSGKIINTPAGDVGHPKEYICGKVPTARTAVPVMNVGNIIDSNNSLYPQTAVSSGLPYDVLVDKLVNAPWPKRFGSMPSIDHFGLERELFRTSISAVYDVNDALSATLQGSYADMRHVSLRDYGPTAFENFYTREGVSTQDTSIEFRVSYDNGGPLSWIGGVAYYDQTWVRPANFGDVVALCVDTFSDSSNPPDNVCEGTLMFGHDANDDALTSASVFGSINYSFNEQFNLSLEGRFQKDKSSQGVTRTETRRYDTFLPRVIAQYTPSDTTNLYFSYSEGVRPGTINQRLVDADAQETAQYLALFPQAQGSTPNETLANYEVGWKQSMLDHRLRFSIAAYYAEWDDMLASVSTAINETCRSTTGIGCRGPAFGEASLGEPATNSDGTPVMSLRGLGISGSSELYGMEVEAQYLVTDDLEVGASYGYAYSEYTDFIFVRVERIAGFSDIAGYSMPRYPKHSAAANLTYTQDFSADMQFFSRLDVFYTGKTFADRANLSYCDAYTKANARAGIQKGSARVELYVENLTDNRDWTACSRWTDFENPVVFPGVTDRQGIAVSAASKRRFGLRVSYDF